LDQLRRETADVAGVSRESYGDGEQLAHDLLRKRAEALGIEPRIDFAGNLYLTVPGRDRKAPGWITGSHLDSVPQGGNYDGAAGGVSRLLLLAPPQQGGRLTTR